MLFTIVSNAILMYLLTSALAKFLTAVKHATNISGLTSLNNSRVHGAPLTSNLSDTLTAHTLLPYGFSVPNTQTYLRLGFGLRRHRLDPMSMGA